MIDGMGGIARRARLKKGYTILEVGNKVRNSPSCVSRWENGEREISCEALPGLAHCLGCEELLKRRLLECPVYAALKKEAA